MSKQNGMTVLLTGGAGYIGSHICVELVEAGYNTVILDNLSNSSEESVRRVEKITSKQIAFYKTDLLDEAAVNTVFDTEKIDAVIHLAGLKAVGESVAKPLEYYHNNITGTLNLINSMRKHTVKNFVFSSSATVYGTPKTVPITEDFPVGNTTNPYGETKLMIERILTDYQKAAPDFNVVILRYFNPVGAHKSGMIGEDPKGIPNNLMPYISQVAVGKLACLNVFGNDYDTPDGTGVRDYIHVVDLANGHVKAIDYLKNHAGLFVFNLGTGTGYSVLDMVNAFGNACGKKINYTFAPRRNGDIAQCYANPEKAEKELGWKAQKTLEDMCADTWNWQSKNPDGYKK
ncbi:MAG: UDP-glucose 4-epimerase GalE [Spirochaetales bacterium]|nr:UDP-glucose 4-epimerase GalE [Spirochaetales bacterium]